MSAIFCAFHECEWQSIAVQTGATLGRGMYRASIKKSNVLKELACQDIWNRDYCFKIEFKFYSCSVLAILTAAVALLAARL